MLSPDELFPEGGEPSAVRLARCGWRFSGWHIEAVLGSQDADFLAYLKLLKALVGDDPDNILRGINPDEIALADLRLAFCWVFHMRSVPDTHVCCADRAGGGAGHHVKSSAAAAFLSTCEWFVSEEILCDARVLVLPPEWTYANADAEPRVYAGLARCDPHMPILVLYDSRASEGGGNVGTDCEFYGIVSSLLLSISEKGFPFVDPTLDPRKLAVQLISLELNVKGLTDQASKCAVRTTVVELTEAFRARGLLEWTDFNGVRLPFTPAPRGTFDSMLTVPLKDIAEKFQAQMRLEPEDVSAEIISSFESIADQKMAAVCERLVDDRSSKVQPHLPCSVLDTHAKPMRFEKGCEEQAVTLVAVTSLDAGVLARAAELRGVMWSVAGRRAALRAGLLKSLRTTTSFEGYKQLFLSTLLELGHGRALEYYKHNIELLQPAPRPAGPESYAEDSATYWKERPLVDSDGEERDPMQQFVCWYDASAECWREGLVVRRNQSSTLAVVPCSLMKLLPSEGKPPQLRLVDARQTDGCVCFTVASTEWRFSGPELLRRPKGVDRNPGGVNPMFFDRLRGWRLVSMMTPPTLNDQEITDLSSREDLKYACALRGSPERSSLGGADGQRSWLRAHYKTPQWQQQQQQQQQQAAEPGTAGMAATTVQRRRQSKRPR